MSETLLWYDLETFGLHPALDRIAQFAALRTDRELTPVDDPLVLFCRLPPDYLPSPEACLTTGITPQKVRSEGLSEYEFFLRIHRELSRPETCTVGFNNLRFDDEFIRCLSYRNLHDPYAREWQNGNSRWDLLDLLRAARDLRPEGIRWPRTKEGAPTLRLEELSRANGIPHEDAHDALADVRATLETARRLRDKQPRLFRYSFDLRKKRNLIARIRKEEVFLHTSRMFHTDRGCTRPVLPLFPDKRNTNKLWIIDLMTPPEQLEALSPDELRRLLFPNPDDPPNSSRNRHPGKPSVFCKGLHLNKCPFIAPLSVLTPALETKLGIDLRLCLKNKEEFLKNPEIFRKFEEVLNEPAPDSSEPAPLPDVDLALYSGGFFSEGDKNNLFRLREILRFFFSGSATPSLSLPDLGLSFQDPRIPELFERLIFRNFSEGLPPREEERRKHFCRTRLFSFSVSSGTSSPAAVAAPSLAPSSEKSKLRGREAFFRELRACLRRPDLSAEDHRLCRDLEAYALTLSRELGVRDDSESEF